MQVLVSLSSYKSDQFDIDGLSVATKLSITDLALLYKDGNSAMYKAIVRRDSGSFEVMTILAYAKAVTTVEYGFTSKQVKLCRSYEFAQKAFSDIVWIAQEMSLISEIKPSELEASLKRSKSIADGAVVDQCLCTYVANVDAGNNPAANQDSATYLAVIGVRARKTFSVYEVSVYRIGRRFAAKIVSDLGDYKALNVAKRALKAHAAAMSY